MRKEIIGILVEYPTPIGAEAVGKFVGDFSYHETACKSRVAMGSVAEATAMELAPSSEAKVSVAAVIILGEIGTERSLPLLLQASSSKNQQVKQETRTAKKKLCSV